MARLRPARATDAGATGAILKEFQDHTPWLPDLHTGAETVAFCGSMIDRGWVTVAETAGDVVGFIARDAEEIHALYVLRRCHGQGIGAQLLDHAKARSHRLCLLVFQANQGANRFYRREGFTEAGRSNGDDNEENLPDVTYVWTAKEARP